MAFGPGCFGVDNAASSLVSMILVPSVGSQLGLSWYEQYIVVLVGLKIDRVSPFRWAVSGQAGRVA